MMKRSNLEYGIPLEDGEITTYNEEDMHKIVSWLLRNNYVAMVSMEDFGLYVINYCWTDKLPDRNQVVFMDRCTFEENYQRVYTEEEKDED